MHFIKVAALLPLAAFTKAWVIPEGTADGVYAVTRGADGKELHTRIASADSALEVRGTDNALGSNILVEIWCGCGFTIDPSNTDSAVNKLKAQLSGGAEIKAHLSFYSITNDVVAFACNRSPNTLKLSADTYGQALAKITGACGRYIAGAVELDSFSNFFDAIILGYQRYKSGDDFCASSTSSPANHC